MNTFEKAKALMRSWDCGWDSKHMLYKAKITAELHRLDKGKTATLLGKGEREPVWGGGWAARGRVDTGVESVFMSQTT